MISLELDKMFNYEYKNIVVKQSTKNSCLRFYSLNVFIYA